MEVVPEHMAAVSSSTQSLKVWQVWPGTHSFCCDGRFMVGPDFGVTVFAFGLTTAVSVCFWFFMCPSLPLPFGVCDVTLYILTVGFMTLTATTDPGIIPRCVRGLRYIFLTPALCLGRRVRRAPLREPCVLISTRVCHAQQSQHGRCRGRDVCKHATQH